MGPYGNDCLEEISEMSDQIIGYYITREDKLLKDFDRTAMLMEPSLHERYGEDFAGALRDDVREEYEMLIPEIPYIEGPRAGMLNSFLLISAQELAVYKAMQSHGKSPGEAWELCHKALCLRLAEFPKWKRFLLRWFMFSGLVKKVVARRARQPHGMRMGDFEIKYLMGNGSGFDYGVDYIECGNYNFVMKHGGAEFAPYVCMSDIALSEAMGWDLTRTQTLADGCSSCDFRFSKGAGTSISSKTPEVQETIEIIRRKESERER